MSKRFTDANKWRDPWFVDLPPIAKLVWVFLCDNCDAAGVWQVHVGLCRAAIGSDIDLGAIRTAFGDDRVRVFDGGRKWHLVKFIRFQYPRGLNPKVAPHRGVLRLLESHGLANPLDELPKGYPTLQDKDKDKDKDQDKDSNARTREPTPISFEPFDGSPVGVTGKAFVVTMGTVGDISAVGGIVKHDDRDGWDALLRRKGFKAIEVAIQAIRARRAKPWLNAVIDEIEQSGPTCEVEGRDYLIEDGIKIPIRRT